ncbi:MAG: beta-N-acetylhexosaminidase [Planctomycetes bacterium]|nr:beta-N-acetylhexosaminidase [Planctomycetota bacterium]
MALALHLLPTPRTLELTGGDVALPAALSVSGVDAEIIAVTLGARARPADAAKADVICSLASDGGDGDEGYRLRIGGTPLVTITARTPTGLRWALTTLAQILVEHPERVPALRIDDAPAFPIRGAMLDISRDRVPTMASLHELVAKMASWKLNHLQLYTEHTFAYAGHEAVWHASSPMTPDEMRELDRICATRGITLTANQNCLGHVERWLKIPGYEHLGELDRVNLLFGAWFHDPNTLIANDPAGLALVKDLLDQLLPTCSGGYVNIGCDEPFDLGHGKSKAAIEKDGFHHVYTRHVSTVASYVRAHGKRPMYWSDAEHAKPEIAALLPADIVPLVWGYDGGTEFAKRGRLFRDRGLEVWVCPGTNNWWSLTSRSQTRRANLARAAREGAEIGAKGFLNTEWGDAGHRQQWPLTLTGIADGAHSCWSGDRPFDDHALGLHVFGVPAMGAWMIALGSIESDVGVNFLGDMNASIFDAADRPDAVAKAQAADAKLAALDAALPACDALIERELRHAVAMARLSCARSQVRGTMPLDIDKRRAIGTSLAELLREHRQLWLKRSRYGGLEQSSDHYKRALNCW